jgi:hypothetical protein
MAAIYGYTPDKGSAIQPVTGTDAAFEAKFEQKGVVAPQHRMAN